MDDEQIKKALAKLNAALPAFVDGTITMTFRGGPRDGEVVSSNGRPKGATVTLAQMLWIQTHGGTVGAAFKSQTPGYTAGIIRALQESAAAGGKPGDPIKLPQGESHGSYIYRVIDRVDVADGANVILDYVGIDPDSVIKPPAS